MCKIKSLENFNKTPVNLDDKRVEQIIKAPLDKDLEKICELLAKD